MKTYFVRHTKELSIDSDTIKRFWKENRIAIHFPYTKGHNRTTDSDSISLDPLDYEKSDKQAIKTLVEISKNGGYICSRNSYFPDECLVGKVEPKTKIEICNGYWDNTKEHLAQYKTFRLEKPQKIKTQYLLAVLAGVPRQGTIREWKAYKDRIENLVEKKQFEVNFENLLPAEQEVMCSEFLRTELTSRHGLAKAEILLTPVGRTLETVDICALTENEENIFAQVTFHKLESKESREKLKKLKSFSTKNDKLIFFCKCEEPKRENNIFIFPLKTVYDEFTSTNNGKKWLKSIQKLHNNL